MTHDAGPGRRGRARRVGLGALGLGLVGVLYALNPAAGGLANWQESTRAIVSREMQRAGEWIVPSIFGEVYLNKPPLLNWLVIGVAEVRGALVSVVDVRLAVAIAGLLGVAATSIVTRTMFRDPHDRSFGPAVAAWAAALLATGVLMVRSSRIGEIDVLLVPTVVTAVGAMLVAWRCAERERRWRPGLIALACLAAALATLAKGPPPIGAIALGGVVAPMVVASRRCELGPARGVRRTVAVALGAVALVVLGAFSVDNTSALLGIVVFAALGAVLGQWAADVARPAAVRAWWPVMWRTQPWLPIAAGLGALMLWLSLASDRVGVETVQNVVEGQSAGNLDLFRAEAAWRNLGFVTYGVGVGSILAWLWLARLVRDRPPLRWSEATVAVWLVLGFALFSLFGKGVARYLTPMWPAVAMLGAVWLVATTRERPTWAKPANLAVGVAVAAMFIGQLWWYGFGRDASAEASERRSIAGAVSAIEPTPVGVISKRDGLASLAFYLDRPVDEWSERHSTLTWGGLAERVERSGPHVVVLRDRDKAAADRAAAEAAGLDIEIVPHRHARYVIFLASRGESGDTGGRTPSVE